MIVKKRKWNFGLAVRSTHKSTNNNDCVESCRSKRRLHCPNHSFLSRSRLIQLPTANCLVHTSRNKYRQRWMHINRSHEMIVRMFQTAEASLGLDIKAANRFVVRRTHNILTRRVNQDGADPIFVRRKCCQTGFVNKTPQTHGTISSARCQIIPRTRCAITAAAQIRPTLFTRRRCRFT